MATIRIIVKKGDVNSYNETQVYIKYGHDQVHCLFGTGIRVTLDQLNKIKSDRLEQNNKTESDRLDQNNPINKRKRGYTSSNAVIRTKYQEIDELKNSFYTQNKRRYPTIHELRRVHDQSKEGSVKASEPLLPVFDAYINQRAPNKATTTIKKYRTSYNHFKTFIESTQRTFTPNSVNQDLYDDFVNYLLEEKDLVDNSVGSVIKPWRVFLRWLLDKGYTFDVDLKKFKILSAPPTIIPLTREELNRLEQYDFGKNKSLDQVRDVFIVSCFTGYRYSDMKRLGKQHIVDGQLNLTAHKNLNDTFVPLAPQVKQIFEKYDYKLPIISHQKFNDYIKDVCKLAEIDKPTEKLIVKGGDKTFITKPKHQWMSAHRAVSTFITICRDNKIPAELVAQITGKTTKIIEKHYYKVDPDRVTEEYNRVWVDPVMKVAK